METSIICGIQTELRWTVNKFLPYPSTERGGICPVLLQQGFNILASTLCNILKASLALRYIQKV